MVELKNQVQDKGIKIKLRDDAVDWLVKQGFDSKMGARPLQRVIDKEIKRPLAKMMLFGDLKNGGIVTIDIADNQLVIIPKVKIAKLEYHEQPSTDQSQT